jgi:hypothetical protein
MERYTAAADHDHKTFMDLILAWLQASLGWRQRLLSEIFTVSLNFSSVAATSRSE